jgi:hypothetical protein
MPRAGVPVSERELRRREMRRDASFASEVADRKRAATGGKRLATGGERLAAGGEPPAGTGVPGRRTVTIQGRGSERYSPAAERNRRPARRAHERAGFRPDRAAMWAVLLGLVLVLVAATSSHAAVIHAHAALTPLIASP